ncbi:MAG TPA: pirin family protein [Acidimicrobiales bacterium]|nr:pirin family protein [Acidimicrobiales bacterium]
MPAITADTFALPRLAEPALSAVDRPVRSVSTAPTGYEGEGFPVRRAFAGVDLSDLDPFIHMDQMGSVDYGPGEPRGTSWHPHRGFETVTYMLDGVMQHQDSHGGGGVIADGATQWMTAGGGILHIETPPEELVVKGGLFHGVQLWVNLPAKDKLAAPRYQSLDSGDVVLLSSSDGGALVRLIAGDLGDHRGPGATHTPITVVHASVAAGARLTLPWRRDFNALAYLLEGSGTAGVEQRPVHSGQLAVFGAGDSLTVTGTGPRGAEVFLLGGRPLREPIAAYGPFVMNTRAELIQAVEDFQSGRFGVIPPDALMPHTAYRIATARPSRPGTRWSSTAST